MRSAFRVIRTVRESMPVLSAMPSCRPRAFTAHRAGIAGPGLLARVLISKYAEHTPLYRQSEMYGRRAWS
ncbi:hypothetical protein ECZU51_27510 [Escherichia coli]|nr:hypothetical protein ECZU51_27510 [Escherichia coli]